MVFWYQKSADQGNADAQLKLGFAYYLGQGVLKDERVARFWIQQAADKGNTDAQKALPIMFR
ncbi:MAG: hypothetical protein ABF760_02825 [Zymomonas mobilis]|uniref:tetratricopeptide repeat protein n=1 Tax=Zymomonas mobilis TaxID=542 RepID=UPI0021AB44AF|nr:hypothetical protein [Zymomonas mobilis]